jgi:hypothetical protein
MIACVPGAVRRCARIDGLEQVRSSCRRSKPVLAAEVVDATELPFVVRDDRMTQRQGLCRDEQVVPADRLTGSFEAGTEPAVREV